MTKVFWDYKSNLPDILEFESIKFLCLLEGKEECELHLSSDEGQSQGKKKITLIGTWDDDLLLSDPYCHGGIHSVRGARYSAWCFSNPDEPEDLMKMAIVCPTPASLEEMIKLYIRDGVPEDGRWCCVGSHSDEHDDGIFDYDELKNPKPGIKCKDCKEHQKEDDVFYCCRCMKMSCYSHGEYIVYVGEMRPSTDHCMHQPVCEKCLTYLVEEGSDPYLIPSSTMNKLLTPRTNNEKNADRYPIKLRQKFDKDSFLRDREIRCYCGNC